MNLKAFWIKHWKIGLYISCVIFMSQIVLFSCDHMEANYYCYDLVDQTRTKVNLAIFDKNTNSEYYKLLPTLNRFAEDGILIDKECNELKDILQEYDTKLIRSKLY